MRHASSSDDKLIPPETVSTTYGTFLKMRHIGSSPATLTASTSSGQERYRTCQKCSEVENQRCMYVYCIHVSAYTDHRSMTLYN